MARQTVSMNKIGPSLGGIICKGEMIRDDVDEGGDLENLMDWNVEIGIGLVMVE